MLDLGLMKSVAFVSTTSISAACWSHTKSTLALGSSTISQCWQSLSYLSIMSTLHLNRAGVGGQG